MIGALMIGALMIGALMIQSKENAEYLTLC